MATTARRMVATSEGGGRPCRQSRPSRRGLFHSQYTTQTDSTVISISSRSCCPWRWWAQVTASQRFLADGNGDGGIQLRPDDCGASSSAGERLAVALAVWHRLQSAMGSRFIIFVCLYLLDLLLYIWPYIIVSSFNNSARLIINSARLIGQ